MAKKTNFESNGKEYFRITKTIGHKADGTPIRKQFYGTGKKEAEEKLYNLTPEEENDKFIKELKDFRNDL